MPNRTPVKRVVCAMCLILCICMSLQPVAAAETTVIIKEALWDIGGGESYEGARARAKIKAEQDAAEEAGVYVESYARTQNYQLTADEVKTIAVAVMQVQVLDEEQRKTGKTSTTAWVRIQATVSNAAVDTLRAKLKSKDNSEQLQQALNETARLQKILDEQNKQLVSLQQQLNQTQNQETREKTLAAITDNDRMTQALEALREARRYAIVLDYLQAENALNRALALKPDLVDAYLTRGDLYSVRKDYALAADAYRQATVCAPALKSAWFSLAVALACQQDYDGAAQAFNQSVDYYPEALLSAAAELEAYQDHGRWGFRTTSGVPVTKAIYDEIGNYGSFYDGLCKVKSDQRVGYVAATKTAALLLTVDERAHPGTFSDGMARVWIGNCCGYMDKTGHLVVAPRFDYTFDFEPDEHLACVRLGDKLGLIDKTGRFVVEPQYDSPIFFYEGLAAVYKDHKGGYIDGTGQVVIPLQYDGLGDFSEGLAAVKVGGQYGYIDRSGVLVIQPRYAAAGAFYQGRARVSAEPGWGYVDKTGNMAIPARYEYASFFSHGQAMVTLDGKDVVIDQQGNVLGTKTDTEEPQSDHTILQPFEFNQKYGYQDAQGHAVIPAIYDNAHYFHEGLAAVKIGNQYGYIDQSGKMMIEPQFKKAGDFSEGLADFSIEDFRYGYIDRQGRQVIAPAYVFAHRFSEGLAAVAVPSRENDLIWRWGYIDRAGKVVIPCQFKQAYDFSEGLAAVEVQTKSVYIDRTGQVLGPAE